MAEAEVTDWLDLRVGRQQQLFNSMDPAPFHDRDLDPAVERYVQEWAEEIAANVPLGIRLTLTDEPASQPGEVALRTALQENFARGAARERRNLRRLFRDGRISLVVGIGFVALAIIIAEAAAARISNQRYAQLVEESVVIGGWVALWQPINIFLYDWWPIRRARKLYDRLAQASIDIRAGGATS